MLGLEYILLIYNMQHVELAERLGIKKQNINLWIKRKQNIPNKHLLNLEMLFGVKKEYFTKELNEIEKIEIQKEKLKKELNPVIENQGRQFKFNQNTIYDSGEFCKIDNDIEKAKLIIDFTNALNLIDDSLLGNYKLLIELMCKNQNSIVLNSTIEALVHYLEGDLNKTSVNKEQNRFEREFFKVFNKINI